MCMMVNFSEDALHDRYSVSFIDADSGFVLEHYCPQEICMLFKRCMEESTKAHNELATKVENQRKELASLLAKNKKLEEENQKLRDINNKNFWPNGKAPVVDFPVIEYKDIPSWFDFTFTNFEYDSRKTLNLPANITIKGVSDDRKKIEAFIEHGDMFSGIFSICRMSDIKDLVDKYNALVVSNRHLELEKASALDSLALVKTNLEGVRKKAEVARDEYEKMKEVLKKWHDATGCDNFDQAKKKIENLHNMIWGGPWWYHPLIVGDKLHTAKGYLEHKGYKCFVDAVTNLEADIASLKNREVQCAEGTYTVFIHPEHMNALKIDIKHDRYQAETRLIEECSELIQALAKRKRRSADRVNYIGGHELMELAHVIISAIVYCKYWDISNELLQKAVQMKYPEPYED